MIIKFLKTIIILSGIVILGFWILSYFTFNGTSAKLSDAEYLRLFPEVVKMVKQKYVEKVENKKLIEGAVNGMLSSLDPHSAYLTPEFFKEMNIEISGSFGGLGIEIHMNDGKLTVISPIDDTPAFRAGIKTGDIIWKIDGKPTKGLNINEAVNRMRGPKGTMVTLTVIRNKVLQPLNFELERDIIRTVSIKSPTLEPGYAYIRIAHFQERTGEELTAALKSLNRENGGKLRGLVIDLRNNPGGLLESAASVAGRFLESKGGKALVVYTKGRDEESRMTLTADGKDKEPGYPIAVLINGGSASASEIVAGALQDHRRAVIVGTQSFGKGSVQTVFPLKGGGGLKLTTALYYTPNGRSIQAKGITPDIIVEIGEIVKSPKKKDLRIHEKDLENHIGAGDDKTVPEVEPEPDEKVSKDKTLPDNQLARALDLLKGVQILAGKK